MELAARLERLEKLSHLLAEEIAALRSELAVRQELPVQKRELVSNKAPSDNKEALLDVYMSLFVGRSDVYAYAWENKEKGIKGWAPSREKNYNVPKQQRRYLPLTRDVIRDHIWNPKASHKGLYVMLPDDTCRVLVCDFDDGDWKADATAYAEVAAQYGCDPLVELSRSGDGAHVWIFFTQPVPARLARQLGYGLLGEVAHEYPHVRLHSMDRFFPAQDTLPVRSKGAGKLGNLIALPLHVGSWHTKRTTVFVDPSTWQEYPEQFARLREVKAMGVAEVEAVVDKLDEQPPEPKPSEHRGPVNLRVAEGVHVPRDVSVAAELKWLASVPNPEFYRKQNSRMSTYGTPRIITRWEERDDELVLPRGLVDDAVHVLERAGYEVNVSRPRPAKKIAVEFTGTLRPEQKKAVRDVCAKPVGILLADPGQGKTVMACAVIGNRKVRTAIVVNRKELQKQWESRLDTFLDCVDGVEVVSQQALARSGPGLLAEYDQIIVDECHGAVGPATEAALSSVKARYWLGLTATNYRYDKLDRLINFQFGPVRHHMVRETGVGKRTVIVRRTPFSSESADLVELCNEIAEDSARVELVAQDVAEALGQGRCCLVLVNRLAGVDAMYKAVVSALACGADSEIPVLTMTGAQTTAERFELRKQFEAPQLCLIAMNKTAGEGLDMPQLDALFLAAPFRFKGLVVQYTGRITRRDDVDAVVYDYVDTAVPMLNRMAGGRHREMEKIGWDVVEG
ncbi:TOTE conflict system archaeo-eukaryotic primase domain-containing protein [Corynebacterium cystitidis]|uniref:TOTE conflict system archaeo-eukaryotic primase domain-containing protein n=1 Tax=Corynebacterium cystitidis TaxID=35757 RepID=UPI00211DEC5B|nr:DEAD/DEAH box helicase family protein [Corynebacterium cystitidis]